MLHWLVNAFREARINAAFAEAEEAARLAYISYVDECYRTDSLKESIRARMAPHIERANETFDAPMALGRESISKLRASLHDNEVSLQLLTRSYKSELATLHVEKQSIYDLISQTKAEKSDAHAALSSARDEIEAWYSRSRGTLIGNGGRKLPRWSLFGQSFGDLDSAKSARDSAYRDIVRCQERLDELVAALREVKLRIAAAKEDRSQAFELRRVGLSPDSLSNAMQRERERVEELAETLQRMRESRREFFRNAKRLAGVDVLEAGIRLIEVSKEKSLQDFSSESAIAERRRVHRAEWLRRNARTAH